MNSEADSVQTVTAQDEPQAALGAQPPSRDAQRVEKILRLVILGGLLIATLKIVAPFLGAIIWAVIIAVSVWPPFKLLRARLGGRPRLAATAMGLILTCSLVVPLVVMGASLAETVPKMAAAVSALTGASLPQPPEWIARIPIVGAQIDGAWRGAINDMAGMLQKLRPYIDKGAVWAVSQGAHLGLALLEFMLAVIIASVLLVGGERNAELARQLVTRLGGPGNAPLLEVAERTIRGVSMGVIGTALIQALLAAIGFAIGGVPAVALLGFLVFILGVMQLPTALVWLPAALWLYYTGATGWAIFVGLWGALIVNTVDNFLRPYLISQGARLPISLIFVGVLGGLLAWGFIGIFLGATLLAVAYTLLRNWMETEERAG